MRLKIVQYLEQYSIPSDKKEAELLFKKGYEIGELNGEQCLRKTKTVDYENIKSLFQLIDTLNTNIEITKDKEIVILNQNVFL